MIVELENVVWRAFSGPLIRFTVGVAGARRFAPGFPPIIAFADPGQPDFTTLSEYCTPGEHFYTADWSTRPPAGWEIEEDTTMLRMVWDGRPVASDSDPSIRRLGDEDVAQVLALTDITRPGPFGPRTLELGEYFGCFDGTRLVAMAGERLFTGAYREISGVCTHPDHQGRGLARKLMTHLISREMSRGERTFLHVMRRNTNASRIYERMGFRVYREVVVRVVTRTS